MPRFADVLEQAPEHVRALDPRAREVRPAAGVRERLIDPGDRAPGTRAHPDRALVTVAFIDIVGSTETAVALGDVAWMELVHRFQRVVRAELRRHGGREVDTAGDGFFVRFAVPARAVHCAVEIARRVRSLGIEIRAGCHTGEVELTGSGVRGVAVAIGARIAAIADAGEVICSSTVRDVTVGSGLRFDDRGRHMLKGIPEAWRLFAVTSSG